MSNEDLKFINVLADSTIYTTLFELLNAAIKADEIAANYLLFSLGIQ